MNSKVFCIFTFLFAVSDGGHVRKARMVNANPTSIEKYPYIAFGGHCTASIIHERYILSALHCYKGANPSDISFWVGVDDRNNISAGVQHYADAIFHRVDEYIPWDAVLIRLAQPITFNSRAQPVKLNLNITLTPGEAITVAGFGATEFGGYSQLLREGNFTFSLYQNNTWMQMEATAPIDGNGMATGDSGAPAVIYRNDPLHCGSYERFQVGIASAAGYTVVNETVVRLSLFASLTPSQTFCTWLKEKSNNEIEC